LIVGLFQYSALQTTSAVTGTGSSLIVYPRRMPEDSDDQITSGDVERDQSFKNQTKAENELLKPKF